MRGTTVSSFFIYFYLVFLLKYRGTLQSGRRHEGQTGYTTINFGLFVGE